MGVLFAVLTSRLFGYAAIAASVVLGFLLVSADFQLRARNAQIATLGNQLTAEQLKTAQAEKLAADINRIVAENDAKNERARADQAVKNSAELQQIQTHATTLQRTLNQRQHDFDTTNAQLEDMVAHVAPTDRRELGPVMLSVIGQLRLQQQARDAGGDYSAAGGH